MAVNLSPVGGVAAQFFDNNGVILTGGKIYTYTAGTTTPQTTYTSNTGATAHSNPIILDASGRVPGGEIWLTDGLSYKFVIKDANEVLIGTYDNVVGINSNFINYTGEQEIQTATASQTVFTLTTMQYQPGTNSLSVFVDGVNQYGPGAQYAFVETSSTVITFVNGLHVGASVKFTTATINSSSYGDAFQISYTPPFTASVATNVGDKLAQFISAKDFGAVGDGVVDDTAAVQDAVDYCIANNLNLLVDGICLLTAPVNIDRQVDGAAFDNYFIISSTNGGGFVVSTAIAMFSSSIAFTTAPVTQLTKFENLVFSTTDNSLAAYVLDGARFLRVRFDDCSFQKIKLLNAPTYTQSIYLTNCNVRRFTGIFFNSQQFTYDFKMVNCLVEAGVSCLRLINPVGCAITASCIEGMSGYAITYEAAQGLSISGNYFESNGLDIDGTDGGTSASNSYGIQLTGNYFANSTATYTIKWYAVLGSISAGNWHTGNMHDFTSSVKEIVVYDVAQGSISNSDTMLTITGGFTVEASVTLSGGTTTPSANLRCNVDADIVTINTPTITVTSNTTAATLATLPTYLRPIVQQIVFARVIDNGATVLGLFIVNTNGVITLAVGADGGAFTNSGTKGIAVNTLTYSLN